MGRQFDLDTVQDAETETDEERTFHPSRSAIIVDDWVVLVGVTDWTE